MARTLVTGNILRSGSIPTTALGGGVVTSSAQIVSAFPTDVVSSSVQVTSFLPTGTVSSSTQVKEYLPTDTVSSSVQITTFLPVNTVSSSGQVTTFLPVGTVSSSTQVKEYLPTDTVSSSVQVTAFLPAGTVSSSTQLPSGIASSSTQVTDYLPTGTVSGSGQINVFSTVGGDTLATTGSNTFTGITTFSNTTNSTSYLDGAVHIAGGMSIQKDLRISGSVNINGLLTVVSMSSQYVTSSQYNLGVSKITVNDDDNVRFAGLSVFDSGSSSPTTASIYWDSLNHKFLYENLSGSAYNSAILIAGPKNTGSLGDEVGLTSGYLPYATGDDHIDNSVMFQSGNNIGVGVTNPAATFQVQGNVSASSFTGSLSGIVATAAQTNITSVGTLTSLTVTGDLTVDTSTLKVDSTNNWVGIGTASPAKLLDLSANNTGITTGDPGNILRFTDTDTTSAAGQPMGRVEWYSADTDGAGVKAYIQGQSQDGSPDGNLVFATHHVTGGGLAERMRISYDGNVGIGVTNPASTKLYVQLPNSGLSTTGNNVQVWAQDGENGLYLRMYASQDLVQFAAINGEQNISIVTEDVVSLSATTTKGIYIKTGGNIGIGTTDPGSYKLQVQGNTKVVGTLETADLQLSNEQLGPNSVDGTTGKWLIQEGQDDLYIINQTNGKKFKFNLIEV